MMASRVSQQQYQNQQSSEDHNAIQNLKRQVCLNNHQLLELTYNDQKFYEKLKQLNHYGCVHIQQQQFTEALVYLNEAEKVLQYAASCGKTIQRNLIVATLNNEASLYQKAWELEKAESYLEAIIYNISSFFQNTSESHLSFTKNILDQTSKEHEDFTIWLWRKKSLVIFYLQYCAVNSQNKNNQRAFSSALKAVDLIKQICKDIYTYENFIRQNMPGALQSPLFNDPSNRNMLLEISRFKSIDIDQMDFQQIYQKAVRYIAVYIKRLQTQQKYPQQLMKHYKLTFQNYSIGTIMQINPIQIGQQTDKVNLKEELSMVQKHFKGIYLSVGHFILGTQGRFIATQKYTLDENQRKNSRQFRQSQIYHICSIIIGTKYLLCGSTYFDHIVNSFRNHYKIDIMEDAKKYLSNNQQLTHQDLLDDEYLFQYDKQQSRNSSPQTQSIQRQESQIKNVHQIAGGPAIIINSEQSEQIDDQPRIQIKSGQIKSVKQSKNAFNNNLSTATKKSRTNINSNVIMKSHTKISTHQVRTKTKTNSNSYYQNKGQPMQAHLLTSRQKQNRYKVNLTNHPNSNVKSSRSKGKSDYKFSNTKIHNRLSKKELLHNNETHLSNKETYLSNKETHLSNKETLLPNKGTLLSNKETHLSNKETHLSNKGTLLSNKETHLSNKETHLFNKDTVYHRKQSDYIPNVKASSKSKKKRISTSNQTDRQITRKKDSYADFKKAKKTEKVQLQYGIRSPSKQIDYPSTKTSRNNLNYLGKSRIRKQNEEKIKKLASPQTKLKKLKSPRNIKK